MTKILILHKKQHHRALPGACIRRLNLLYIGVSLVYSWDRDFSTELSMIKRSFSIMFRAGFRMRLIGPSEVVIVRRFSKSDWLMVRVRRMLGNRTPSKTATPMMRFIRLLKMS